MNKWIKRAIFINALFIVSQAVADYALWMRVPVDMASMREVYGAFTNLEVEANDYLLFKYMRFSGAQTIGIGELPPIVSGTCRLPNLPFAIFLAMIPANLFLLKKATSADQTQ